MPTKRTPPRTPRRVPPRKRSAAPGESTPPPGTRRRSRAPEAETPREPLPSEHVPLELEARFEEALEKIRSEVVRLANKGRHTKVRFKFRGRQLLPDIPLAAMLAAEGLSFYWAGLLRALVVNVAGGALIDIELVNDSEKVISQGREALLAGDVEKALEHFRKATEMDRDRPEAWLNLGVASKLRGDVAGAREALEKARALAGKGPTAAEAERVLKTLQDERPPPKAPSDGQRTEDERSGAR